ncbi:MAG: hypothetical protein PHQ35_09640 [Phycisphaerae bacterium]|nr:hypothetical protein [Phycisphaerae bacterium]MDD5239977.1 hypothetical protein [Candidatus Nanoarchaeia archaeon]
MAKLKVSELHVGDKVRGRTDLKAGKRYGNVIMYGNGLMMEEIPGKELTIQRIDALDNTIVANSWWLHVSMVEPIE